MLPLAALAETRRWERVLMVLGWPPLSSSSSFGGRGSGGAGSGLEGDGYPRLSQGSGPFSAPHVVGIDVRNRFWSRFGGWNRSQARVVVTCMDLGIWHIWGVPQISHLVAM